MIKKVIGFVSIFCFCVVFGQNGAGFNSEGIYYSAAAAATAGSSFVYDGPPAQPAPFQIAQTVAAAPVSKVQPVITVVHTNCAFDAQGYDCAGYDYYGYDREGYDVAGYDANSFDREGYNIAGYSIYGYDREGYSADGYDAYGYDRDGYDAYGLNVYGYYRDGTFGSK